MHPYHWQAPGVRVQVPVSESLSPGPPAMIAGGNATRARVSSSSRYPGLPSPGPSIQLTSRLY
eukprot:3275516-Rhodomonas_salina.1